MNKQEQDITPAINLWFSFIYPTSAPWEIKHTREEKTFKLSEIKVHQWDYLEAATTARGCTYKIVDFGPTSPPFDVLHYKNSDAFVIVAFPKRVHAIHILDMIAHREKKTTMTEAEAEQVSKYSIDRKKLPQ